ncbi:RICIN domain-containing protein [Actinomadura sp. DC4]|uniref:RICIN domain-containing protein n=1 Tax=Actinomadura sp. DC4 TaxID=3055069 RepID=UPI0025B22510|nr:RICIN domain-containing protein [Actinomadura sp. DC4]MDN3357674.1 RICIN domain-containing protein [Actinomadura sp. DC4]
MAFPRRGRVLAAIPLLLSGPALALPAAASPGAQRLFTANLVNRHSNLCLSVDGAAYDNGARMLQWDCGPRDNQQWNFAPTTEGYYQVRSDDSGKCLSVSNAATHNGAPVLQWDCGTRDNQKWRLVQRDDGFFAIVARNSQKCLSILDRSTDNGAPALQWECGSHHEQHWRLA